MARGPDIIQRTSIPLSAVSDAPVIDPARPPLSASGSADDQARGVAKEITPEQLAQAEQQRAGDPSTASGDLTDPAKPAPEQQTQTDQGDDDAVDDDGIQVPVNLPGYANKEIAKIRKQARDRVNAIREAVQTEVGSEKWEAAWKAAEAATVAKLTADADKNARAAAKAQQDLDAAMARLKTMEDAANAAPTDQPANTDPRPTRDQFDDPDEYDEALTSWGEREGDRKATKAIAEKEAADKKAAEEKAADERREAHEAEITRINTDWQAKVTKAKETYSDYDAVTNAEPKDGGPTITDPMVASIMQLENGTDVAYYLGQNVEESVRIANIPNPFLVAMEMGKLSQRLATPAQPRRRSPRPLEPVDTSVAPTDGAVDEPDMETYAANRNKALRGERRPFFPASNVH